MGLFLTTIAALVIWVVLWGTDLMKSFDAFLIALVLIVLAAAVRLLKPFLGSAGR